MRGLRVAGAAPWGVAPEIDTAEISETTGGCQSTGSSVAARRGDHRDGCLQSASMRRPELSRS